MQRTCKAEFVALLALLAKYNRPAYRELRAAAWDVALSTASKEKPN